MIKDDRFEQYKTGSSGGSNFSGSVLPLDLSREPKYDFSNIPLNAVEMRRAVDAFLEPNYGEIVYKIYRGLMTMSLGKSEFLEQEIEKGFNYMNLLMIILNKKNLEGSIVQPGSALNIHEVLDIYDSDQDVNLVINPSIVDVIDHNTPEFIDYTNIENFLGTGRKERVFIGLYRAGTPSYYYIDISYDPKNNVTDLQIFDDLEYESHGWLPGFGESK